MQHRRTLISRLLGSLALTTWAASAVLMPLAAQAQDKLVMKAADVHPAGYPNVVAIENMGKKLAAATNGRISFQMFPGSVLGGEKEMSSRPRSARSRSCAPRWARSVRWCPRSTSSTCRLSSATRSTCVR